MERPGNDADLSCGWFRFKPKLLQRLNTPKWFIFFLTIFSTVSAMIVNGLTSVGLSTLEKRFNLSSKQAGMIIAASDASSLFLIVFISYYGGHRHKAKWLAYGALVTSMGCLLFALPHTLAGKYQPLEIYENSYGKDTCLTTVGANSTHSLEICSNEGSSDWKYMFIFIGARILLGAGTTPLYTLGPVYIDENVHPESAPMYLGVWFVVTFFGPGLGFVAGGSLLNIYVDLNQPPELQLTPDDPRWIGAWWLGYFFGGITLFLTTIALLGYPREMPGTREMRNRAIKQGIIPERDDNIQGRLEDLLPATKALLTNPTYMFNTLALTSTTVLAYGLGPFVSKFIQAQFGETTVTAGILTGVVIIPATAGGVFLGSYLVKRMKLTDSCRSAAKLCFIFQFIGTWGVLTFLIPGCKTTGIAGVNIPYENSFDASGNLTALCNMDCHCSTDSYFPVCGEDGLTYFAPCFAGCKKELSSLEFSDCACISVILANNTKHYSGSAKKGVCDRDCKNLVPFLFGALVFLLSNFINVTPNKTVVLRSVPDNQRSYALGLQWLFISSLGSMPGPVYFGSVLDRTCNLWEKNCGKDGNCLEYNNELLSYIVVTSALIFQVIATVTYFLSWYFCKTNQVQLPASADRISWIVPESEDIQVSPQQSSKNGSSSKPSEYGHVEHKHGEREGNTSKTVEAGDFHYKIRSLERNTMTGNVEEVVNKESSV